MGSDPFDEDVKKVNLKKILSNDYLGSLQTFVDEIQRFYIIKAKNALNQMSKVDFLLNEKIKEME